MRRSVGVALVAAAVGCGDDVSDGGTTSSTSSSGSSSTTVDGSAESMLPCESEESRFTVFLADPSATAFVLTIEGGVGPTIVACPDGTIDGQFALHAECGIGEVTLFEQRAFPELLVRIAIDDDPLVKVDITCQNTSMCPNQERNVCETHLAPLDTSSSDGGASESTT